MSPSMTYHASLILLHRPFVPYCEPASATAATNPSSRKFDPSSMTDSSSGADSDAPIRSHFIALSRSVCTDSARRIVAILQRYKSRFDPAQAFGTAIQHAGIAASTLMGEILLQQQQEQNPKTSSSRASPEAGELIHADLQSLRLILGIMSRNYQPAAVMAAAVDHFLSGSQATTRPGDSTSGQQPLSHGCDGSSNPHPDYYAGIDPDIFSSSAGPARKRARLDGPGASFLPSRGHSPASPGPGGLPFLSSSFLESLGADESAFTDLGDHSDYAFPWDATSSLGFP